LLIGHDILFGRLASPIDNRFEANLNSQSLPLILIKQDIVSNALLHGPIVIVNNFLQILMDDAFSQISLEDSKIRDFFLVGFYFIVGGNVVDDAIDPDCFDVGDVARFDFVGDVVHVTLVDLLFAENFGL